MNRKGFIRRILAALGVGAVVSVGKPSLSEATPIPGHDLPPPAPPVRLGHSLEGRLTAMIARDRARGLEVNYFHTTRATLEDLWSEVGMPFNRQPGYQAIVFHDVTWWGCEDMAPGEILISDTGITPGDGLMGIVASSPSLDGMTGNAYDVYRRMTTHRTARRMR